MTASSRYHTASRRATLLASLIILSGLAGCLTSQPPPISQAAPASPTSSSTLLLERIESGLFSGRPHWRRWAAANLQTGDLVFTRGNHYILLGTLNFTDLATTVSQGEFSHVGMVVVEDNEPVVYDVSERGVSALPFGKYVTQYGFQRVTIRRPDPAIYHALPAAVAHIRQHAAKGTPFDHKFAPGDDKLYCTELIANAFQAGGVELCQQSRIGDLPGISELNPITVKLVSTFTKLDHDSQMYCLGNATYGLIGSPLLSEVLPPTATDEPPKQHGATN
ncbi:YiiX/YebB-like N1pC/P60 family cysteine hydrolase [Planctomycetaceae bacterium SH139]